MKGFGCCRHKLLTFSLRVNWNLSPGFRVFSDSQGIFSEMNGFPLLTRWEQQGSGVRCYSVCVCVCRCMCVSALHSWLLPRPWPWTMRSSHYVCCLTSHTITLHNPPIQSVQTTAVEEKVPVTSRLCRESGWAWTLTQKYTLLYSPLRETWCRVRW